MRLTIKGSASSGWYGPPKGTHGSKQNIAGNIPWVQDVNNLALTRGSSLYIPKDWKVQTVIAPGIQGKKNSLCYKNSLDYANATGARLMVGWQGDQDQIDKLKHFDEEKYWHPSNPFIPHAWNVDEQGRVVDTSFGTRGAKGSTYIGVEVNPKDFPNDSALHSFVGDLITQSPPGASDDAITAEYTKWQASRSKSMKFTIKGGPGSGWHAPPRGTHSGGRHRAVGSGKVMVSKKPVPKRGLGSSPVRGTSDISAKLRGANVATVVTYEDGTKAIFKPASGMDMGDVGSEVLAYEFSESIGWDLVPETTVTEIGGKAGSLQQWVPDSMDGYGFYGKYGRDKITEVRRGRDYTRMRVMDRMISNPDRHDGNFVVDKAGRAWAIDNGLAFTFPNSMESYRKYVHAWLPSRSKLAMDIALSNAQRRDYADAYTDVAKWSKTPAYRDYVKSVRSVGMDKAADRLEYAVALVGLRYG